MFIETKDGYVAADKVVSVKAELNDIFINYGYISLFCTDGKEYLFADNVPSTTLKTKLKRVLTILDNWKDTTCVLSYEDGEFDITSLEISE